MLFYVCVHANALFVLQDLKTPQLSRADSKDRVLKHSYFVGVSSSHIKSHGSDCYISPGEISSHVHHSENTYKWARSPRKIHQSHKKQILSRLNFA